MVTPILDEDYLKLEGLDNKISTFAGREGGN